MTEQHAAGSPPPDDQRTRPLARPEAAEEGSPAVLLSKVGEALRGGAATAGSRPGGAPDEPERPPLPAAPESSPHPAAPESPPAEPPSVVPQRPLSGPQQAGPGPSGPSGPSGPAAGPPGEPSGQPAGPPPGPRSGSPGGQPGPERQAPRPGGAPRPAVPRSAARPAAAAGRSRRARLRLRRIDPYSVFVLSLLVSLFLAVVLVVAVVVLYAVLESAGVPDSVNALAAEVTRSPGEAEPEPLLSASRALTTAGVIAVVDVVLLTALATLGAVLYNLCAGFTGGLEVTLAEEG